MENAINLPKEQVSESNQYTLGQIIAIWLAVSVPMPILGFVIAPILFPVLDLHPGFIYTFMIVIGLMWQFVVSMWVMKREIGELSWSAIQKRMWIQHPRNPQTGERDLKLWWMIIPALIVGSAASLLVLVWTNFIPDILPFMSPIEFANTSKLFTPEFAPTLVGQWWIFAVLMFMSLFNYFLGEEFIFRGVLLPRMQGVFGKWDWVANGFLFGAYHWHLYWNIPAIIFLGFALSGFTRRYRSMWFAVIMHAFLPLLSYLPLAAIIGGWITL